MAPFRVFISASTQSKNIGVDQFGTEQDRMQQLADRVAYWLSTQKGKFATFRNQPGWSLDRTVDYCNNLQCDIFIDNHTNAGPVEEHVDGKGAEGTETFYNGFKDKTSASYKLASILYAHIAPLSKGGDRGVKADTSLYKPGLYVVQKTTPPATLIEVIFHTNKEEVADYIAKVDQFAKAEAKAICEYFGVKWDEPVTPVVQTTEKLVEDMVRLGIITDAQYWVKVLSGKVQADPSYLQVAFRRAISKVL